MRNFVFVNKNEPVTLSIRADNFEEAEELLFYIVKNDYGWYVESEEGEEV